MMGLMRRRALLTTGSAADKPLALVNGSYYSTINVTNGNHLDVAVSNVQWKYLDIPFTKTIPIKTGDVISIKLTGTPPRGNNGLTLKSGSHLMSSDDHWISGNWKSVTAGNDGEITHFFTRSRGRGSYSGSFSVSIMLNNDVIL